MPELGEVQCGICPTAMWWILERISIGIVLEFEAIPG